jgi:hypothetical protein
MKIMDTEIIIQAEKVLAKAHLGMDITTIAALRHEDYSRFEFSTYRSSLIGVFSKNRMIGVME